MCDKKGMKILTHILAGMAIGIAMAPNPPSFLAAIAGSVCPDKLDTLFSFGNRDRWSRIHRTWSHNLAYWLVPVFVWLWFWPFRPPPPWAAVEQVAVFFCLGVFSHLLLDFLNPTGIGICPFASARSRVGLGIVRTNSLADILTGILLLGSGIAFRWHAGFNAERFFGSVLKMSRMGYDALWKM